MRSLSGDEELANGVSDTHFHNGQLRNCPSGDNSTLYVRLLAADLLGLRKGNFRETFNIQLDGGDFPFTESNGATLTVRIRIPNILMISALDDVDDYRRAPVNSHPA